MMKINHDGSAESSNIEVINKMKICPICNKAKLIDTKIYESPDKSIHLELPVFSCKCRQELKEKSVLKEAQDRARHILGESRIDSKFLINDYKCYRPELKPYFDSLDWIKQNKSLMIYGIPGNHKTGHTTAIMKKCASVGISVLYYRASEVPGVFIEKKRQQIDYLHKAKVLCLDNFGKHSIEASGDIIFNLLDWRMHNGKITILITNGNMADVSAIYSLPLMSRILGQDFIKIGPIGIDGEDLRGEFKAEFKVDFDD